jgi:hypothetical protein
MPDFDLKIQCQRCGEQMEMKDPALGQPWQPNQFWVCPNCGRHFWTTYANPPGAAASPATPPAKTPAAPKTGEAAGTPAASNTPGATTNTDGPKT